MNASRPTNDTACIATPCSHKLGIHYKRFDGVTGCAGYTGQQDEFPCSCKGFAVVYDPTTVAQPTHRDTVHGSDNDMRR